MNERVLRVTAHAMDTLGPKRGLEWMLKPHRELDDQRPVDLLEDPENDERVDAILGRIDHGVFS